jgi:hypothetical protein
MYGITTGFELHHDTSSNHYFHPHPSKNASTSFFTAFFTVAQRAQLLGTNVTSCQSTAISKISIFQNQNFENPTLRRTEPEAQTT